MKIIFARFYQTHSSYNARDFLYRLNYLLDGKIENVQTDISRVQLSETPSGSGLYAPY